MKIGDKVILIKPIDMGYYVYQVGHEFTITGCDDMRGFDLRDDDGNCIGETRFVQDHYILLSDHIQKNREKKIDQII